MTLLRQCDMMTVPQVGQLPQITHYCPGIGPLALGEGIVVTTDFSSRSAVHLYQLCMVGAVSWVYTCGEIGPCPPCRGSHRPWAVGVPLRDG